MLIGLHDAEKDHMPEKTFPNLALMRLSAYHKAKGDTVRWWHPDDWVFGVEYDTVYSSKVFDYTPENKNLPPNTVKGGSGYGLYEKLPDAVDMIFPDYSIYPECDYALGYITRGCPNHCRHCIVPLKEGDVKPYSDWRAIVRKDTKNLTLLDDNILSCTYGIEQLEELSHTDYRLDLNQGMDANLVTPEIARILSAIKWQKFIRFSCDTRAKIPAIERTVSLLNAEGIPVSKIYSYLIVTEDIRDAVTRVEELKRIGIQCIYAQAEINPRFGIIPNPAMKEFAQRYVIKHKSYTYETWERYCERNGFDPYEADLGKSKRGGRGKRANRDTEDSEAMQTTLL